jgi:hypothetical protein
MERRFEVCPLPPYSFTNANPSHPQGETIPIRLFLGGFELTPTFRDVNKKFSTRYYLNLVLVDEENRRYFKSSEITIFRCVGRWSLRCDAWVLMTSLPLSLVVVLQNSVSLVSAIQPSSLADSTLSFHSARTKTACSENRVWRSVASGSGKEVRSGRVGRVVCFPWSLNQSMHECGRHRPRSGYLSPTRTSLCSAWTADSGLLITSISYTKNAVALASYRTGQTGRRGEHLIAAVHKCIMEHKIQRTTSSNSTSLVSRHSIYTAPISLMTTLDIAAASS